jgi:adenylate cyclase
VNVNKSLGDGALAVFCAPNHLADDADAAVTAAVSIHRLVAGDSTARFGSASGSTPVWLIAGPTAVEASLSSPDVGGQGKIPTDGQLISPLVVMSSPH